MTRFHGQIGYVETEETAPGVYVEQPIEYSYKGDVKQDLRKLQTDESLNGSLILQNHLSIVADKFAEEHFHQIRYVKWDGVYWQVNYVEVRRPRLILRFGGVYNGVTA